jgi:hypothetical protein
MFIKRETFHKVLNTVEIILGSNRRAEEEPLTH